MNSFKFIISYQGTYYHGWQKQIGEKTVQGELEGALSEVVGSGKIRTLGSGRTDSGVHALAQVVRVDLECDLAPNNLLKATNAHLPKDIRVIEVHTCPSTFHPVFQAKSKHYHYLFCLPEENGRSLFQKSFVAQAPRGCDLNLLLKALPFFVGEKDFINFRCEGTPTSTTIREIFNLELVTLDPQFSWNKTYCLKFHGNGFLKQMVRLIVGALWDVSRGKTSFQELHQAFLRPQVERIGPTAPPEGLYLVNVEY